MRQEHNKLIRDRIPEIIRQTGRKCEVETMSQTDYHQALLNKLVEDELTDEVVGIKFHN